MRHGWVALPGRRVAASRLHGAVKLSGWPRRDTALSIVPAGRSVPTPGLAKPGDVGGRGTLLLDGRSATRTVFLVAFVTPEPTHFRPLVSVFTSWSGQRWHAATSLPNSFTMLCVEGRRRGPGGCGGAES